MDLVYLSLLIPVILCLSSCLSWGIVLGFAKNFGCQKPQSVALLFWFVSSTEFIQVASQILINFRNHTDCRVYQFDELGLLRSDCG